jgi:endo-1,4-beta-xylanase
MIQWMYIEPEQGVFDFAPGEVVGDLAKKNGQLLRCHNLVWHSQLPDWVNNGNWTKETLSAVLVNHVTQVVKHWKGRCYAWDVVNEGLNDDGTFRETVFYNVIGEEYFALAFKTAAKFDPKVKLYYNDYNLEARSDKTKAAQALVRSLKKQGVKIDGVGAQAHLVVGSTPTLAEQIQNLNDFVATGVEVAQTELDIRLELPVNATNLAQQSKDYETTVAACVAVKGCVGTTIWDFYDPYSWVPTVFAGEGAATLYFEDFTKHPAYWGVVKALAGGVGAKHPHWPWPFNN